MKHEAPRIDAKELQTFVEATLPHATVSLSIINPQYQSWSLTINANDLWYEYSWGPLSGFGFTDVNAEQGRTRTHFLHTKFHSHRWQTQSNFYSTKFKLLLTPSIATAMRQPFGLY
jgi:hypothetical protein